MLIKLEDPSGNFGWGEISPFNASELYFCKTILEGLGNSPSRQNLEEEINNWPGSLGFAIGAALAEMDYLIGNNSNQKWLQSSTSAVLLPNDESLLKKTLDSTLENHSKLQHKLTFKWKVGIKSNDLEERLLQEILYKLPANANLRIDANGSWERSQAKAWMSQLQHEPRLEWLEQPLPMDDIEGLKKLSQHIPVALDESLLLKPSLRKTWKSWQIRRPLIEGDPRYLLKELNENVGYRVISTCFETGIGRRWVEHLASLQQQGPTPTLPGLAPGWCPDGPLFSNNPQSVWEAA
ncbi:MULTISPECIES: o-succinylbenzoate synthase [unclassified Prochlorococcus]|uniref:o-succinylbenzoate synthase n=1 Tax=unclassified Prochlorococcus TaxID=2627481 RepID=UPI001F4CD9AD|nr:MULTISPECIES: o-succinylbenzoate synthase [unclassified Prochlorococcus]